MIHSFRRWTRVIPLVCTVVLAAGCAAGTKDAAPKIGGDFTLTDHNSSRFELASLRGKVVLVFFGYSMCPDVCPTTLSKLATVARRLGPESAQLKTLYITVDPDRDTPEVLKADLALFNLDALGLTGTRAELDSVVAKYGASYKIVPTPESAGKYSVSHSTTLYVLDKTGAVVLTFPYEATAEQIVEGITPLLRSGT